MFFFLSSFRSIKVNVFFCAVVCVFLCDGHGSTIRINWLRVQILTMFVVCLCVYFFFSHYIYIDITPEFSLFILGSKNIIHQIFNIIVWIFSRTKKKLCISTFVPLFLFDLLISSFWSQCLVFPHFIIWRELFQLASNWIYF